VLMALGALGAVVLLRPGLLPAGLGMAGGFRIGAALGLGFCSCGNGSRRARVGELCCTHAWMSATTERRADADESRRLQ